jgi:hypothetical protein
VPASAPGASPAVEHVVPVWTHIWRSAQHTQPSAHGHAAPSSLSWHAVSAESRHRRTALGTRGPAVMRGECRIGAGGSLSSPATPGASCAEGNAAGACCAPGLRSRCSEACWRSTGAVGNGAMLGRTFRRRRARGRARLQHRSAHVTTRGSLRRTGVSGGAAASATTTSSRPGRRRRSGRSTSPRRRAGPRRGPRG